MEANIQTTADVIVIIACCALKHQRAALLMESNFKDFQGVLKLDSIAFCETCGSSSPMRPHPLVVLNPYDDRFRKLAEVLTSHRLKSLPVQELEGSYHWERCLRIKALAYSIIVLLVFLRQHLQGSSLQTGGTST